MLLSQEYLNRYALSCPVIFRPEKEHGISLLFMAKQPSNPHRLKWAVLNVQNKVPNQGPPFYTVDWSQPNYNSGHQFTHLSPTVRIEWDEYDSQMVQLLRGFNNMEPILDSNFLQLFCWEIFLFCNDEAIASLPIAVQKSFWMVLDETLPMDDRLLYLSDCVDSLGKYKNLVGRYNAVKQVVQDRHVGWLANIAVKIRTEPAFAESLAQTV
jgi:hypothetical protein